MDEEEEVQNGKVEIRLDKVRGEVTLIMLFLGDVETLMQDVNFQAKPGKILRLGPTGAGKTTLMNFAAFL